MDIQSCFNLGYISKTVGNKGELILVLDVDHVKRYKNLESVFVEVHKQLVPFFITKMELRAGSALVSFDGINTVERGEELKGSALYLPLSFLPPKKGKEFYHHELPGFTAITKTHGTIGIIQSILDYPQQALFQIKKEDIEILIPVNKEFIVKIDREARTIELNPPEGLIDLYLDPTANDPENE